MASSTLKMSPSATIRHNVRPSHETTPATVASGPSTVLAFLGVMAVGVLPVVSVLATPRGRALLRAVLPRF